MICFYHNDLDGKCSAGIVKLKHGGCKFYPVSYNKPLPIENIVDGENVIIVDFTPNTKEDFTAILDKSNGNVVWIDHHKINIDKFTEFDDIIGMRSDTIPSGAMLTWNYMFGYRKTPKVVEMVSDYDTWAFSIDDTADFVSGCEIADIEPESEFWEIMLETQKPFINELIGDICEDGRTILKYKKCRARDYLRGLGIKTEFWGKKTIACNIAYVNSKFFDSVKDEYEIFMPYYFDGSKWVVSIYTESDDIDLADIAKRFGGGGHRKAAGFSAATLPFRKG